MAKSPNSKSKSHLFLSCFGFSGKFRRFKPLKPAASHRKRPFSWIKFHSKQPPVHSTFPAEQNRSKPDSDRLSSKPISLTATSKSSNEDFAVAVPVATNRAGEEIKPEEVKNGMVAEKIVFESRQHSDSPKKLGDQTESRFSLTRKLDSFRSGRFTQPAPLTGKNNLKSTNRTPAISHSLSFPQPNPTRIGRVNEPLAGMRVGSNNGGTSKTYRSAVATSILIITLAIMGLWGRICAILCTAMWIFIVASLRSIFEEEDDTVDFFESHNSFSEGFKNKLVVLKGFFIEIRGRICSRTCRN